MPVKLQEKHRRIIAQRIKGAQRVWRERWKNEADDGGFFATRPERNKALIAGTYWDKRGAKDTRWVNEIAPSLLVQHAVVTGGNTEFLLKATRSKYEPFKDSAQALLNHTWRTQSFDKACKEARWDIPSYGFGVVEVGWVWEEDHRKTPEGDPDEIGEVTAAAPLRDDPYVERVCPEDLLIDPQCTRLDLSDARYVFRVKNELLANIKANRKYRNTRDLAPTRNTYLGRNEQDQPVQPDEDCAEDAQLIRIYDGYIRLDVDRDGRAELLHVIWAEGSDKELLCEEPEARFEGGNPYPWEIIINWRADQDTFEPIADCDQARWLQVMHDESETQLDGKRRTGNDLLLGPEQLMQSDEFKTGIQSTKQNTYVPVNPAFIGQIKFLERPPANVEAYKSLESTQDRIREQIGTNDLQMNNLPDRRRLEIEVQALQEQGGTRQNDQIEAYKDFRARVGYKVLTLLQTFADQDREYPALDDEQRASWIDALDGEIGNGDQGAGWNSVSIEQLRGTDERGELERPGVQFMVEINASSIGTRSLMVERNEALQLAEMAMQAIEIPDPLRPGTPMVNVRPILRRVLKTFNLPDINEVVAPEPAAGDKTAMLLQMAQQALQENEQLKGMLQQQGQQMQQMAAQLQQFQQLLMGGAPPPGPQPGPEAAPPQPGMPANLLGM